MIINKGDIFKVGEQIIGCGDSTDSNFVSQVIGNKKIRAVISYLPYGVDYGANTKKVKKYYQ